jgi:hypothetical protein
MYITKEDVRYDQILQAELQRVNSENPTPSPNTGLDYSAIRMKFTFAWRAFQYQYIGDPLRGMFPDIEKEEEEEDDEFGEVHDIEDIQNTPIQECVTELVSSLNPDTSDSDLLTSFTLLVDIAFEIGGRIDRFVENLLGEPADGGYESRFFRGIYDGLMDGAKLLRSRKIVPRHVVYALYHISPPFVNVVSILGGEKPQV